MGTADRDYTSSRPYDGGGTSRLTPVAKFLLIANLAVFVLDVFFLDHALARFGAFTVQSAIFEGRVWEFFTFQFLHGGLGHLAFNCIGIYFFAPFLERHLGSRKFTAYYLLCGAAGAALFTLLVFLKLIPGSTISGLVGASAGIYGILVGVAIIAPAMRVRLLLPPVELSMRQLAIWVLGISAFLLVTGMMGNQGGEAGHLGGAILGFLFMRHPGLLAWAGPRRRDVEIIRPKAFRRRSEPKIRPRSSIDLQAQSEVDRILDKISRDGFQSLTDAEREILHKASQSQKSK